MTPCSDPHLAAAYHYQADMQESHRHGFVYFIGEADRGPIKIGMSRSPSERLKVLRWRTKRPLEIMALRQGLYSRELAYHAQFGEHRLEGEWFARHPDILAEIAHLRPTPSEGEEG